MIIDARSFTLTDEEDSVDIDWDPVHEMASIPAELKHLKLHKETQEYIEEAGISQDQFLREALWSPRTWPVPGSPDHMTWLAGHRYDVRHMLRSDYLGPCEGIDLMIIGAAPEDCDEARKKHLNDMAGKFLREEIRALNLPEHKVYYTTVCRHVTPLGESKIVDKHYSAGYMATAVEALTVRPKVILCMGAPGVKALWGRHAKVSSMRGNAQEWMGIPVIVTTNPVQFLSGYAGLEEWKREVQQAASLAFGDVNRIFTEPMEGRDYRLAIGPKEFKEQVDSILATDPDLLVFDCEWGNDHGRDEFGHTISCQVSWGPKTACFFALRKPGDLSQLYTNEEYQQCIAELDRLLRQSRARIGGQNVRVDVHEMLKHGIDLREKMCWAYDSMIMHHMLHQDDDQGLEVLVRKYCPEMGAYWQELEDFLDFKEKRTDPGRASKLRHGYRDVPLGILVPYGQCDGDATFRAILGIMEEWNLPKNVKIRKLYAEVVMPANDGLMEIELNGVRLDEQRLTDIQGEFQEKYDEILLDLQESINWYDNKGEPCFKPTSTHQVCQLLFRDTPYKEADKKRHLVPPEGRTLSLTPICNTDKYPKDWELIQDMDQEKYNRPSTKAESLQILITKLNGHKLARQRQVEELEPMVASGEVDESQLKPFHDAIEDLDWQIYVCQSIHDLKILKQFLSNFLKIPRLSDEQKAANELFEQEHGRKPTATETGLGTNNRGERIFIREDGNSFRECIRQRDGRAAGTILQTTGTGRCRMFRANLQVFPKKQEKQIERIFGRKVDKVKACVIPQEPDEDGDEWVITEADFKQAENWIMAIAGHDETMLQILVGGRDLHSENCFHAFKVPMPEYWGWNGDDPEEGKKCSVGDDLEHIRRVLPFDDLLNADGSRRQNVDGVPMAAGCKDPCDYDVWASVIKAIYPDKRTAAKSISFGIPYGRSARALAREIRKAGIEITDEETDAIVAAFYETYTGVAHMLETARSTAIDPNLEYVESPFGRRRYFTGASRLGKLKQSSAQREAGNFPIQGTVADLLYQALNNFMLMKKSDFGQKYPFKMCLVIHDAVLIEHKKKDTEKIYEMIKFCMADACPIPDTGGKCLGVDIESFTEWGNGKTLTSRDAYSPKLELQAA